MEDPHRTLVDALDGHHLPFLVKFLGIEKPLSIQVHPTSEQALVGFAHENSLGIPLDAPHRNYKDSQHKPEIVIALQDGFRALCGFRPMAECIDILESFSTDEFASANFLSVVDKWLSELKQDSIQQVFTSMMTTSDDVAIFLSEFEAVISRLAPHQNIVRDACEVALLLLDEYPADPGVVTSLLLNSVTINFGEALFLPAGNVHAYLYGLGFEVMAASDNVIRGGLTPKHIDVDELLQIIDFAELPIPRVTTRQIDADTTSYPIPVSDFTVTHFTLDGSHMRQINLKNEAIIVCPSGSITVTCNSQSLRLDAGHAAYASNSTDDFQLSGAGQLFIVSVSEPSISI